MADRDWPTEELTEEEARFRHPDAEFVHVYSVVDQDGERRPAIFVWLKEDETDQDPEALYWLK